MKSVNQEADLNRNLNLSPLLTLKTNGLVFNRLDTPVPSLNRSSPSSKRRSNLSIESSILDIQVRDELRRDR